MPTTSACPDVAAKPACLDVAATEWDLGEKIGEGTYGHVHAVKRRRTGEVAVFKRPAKVAPRRGITRHGLRELALGALAHENIIGLRGAAVEKVGKSDGLTIVLEHGGVDLDRRIRDARDAHTPLPARSVACIMRQCVDAVAYLHRKWIMHRDLKPANVLLTGDPFDPAQPLVAKLVDFGLARSFRAPPQPFAKVDARVVSLFWRAPELLLNLEYGPPVDVWSLGCILAELVGGSILFKAGERRAGASRVHVASGAPMDTDAEQLHEICDVLGGPADTWADARASSRRPQIPPKHEKEIRSALNFRLEGGEACGAISKRCLDLMTAMLSLEPSRRPMAREVASHEYFSAA